MRVYGVRVQVERTGHIQHIAFDFSCVAICGFFHGEKYELYLLVESLGFFAEGYDQLDLRVRGLLLTTVCGCGRPWVVFDISHVFSQLHPQVGMGFAW